jgi:hypothetical protein
MLESRRELVDRYLAFVGELADPTARTIAEQLLDSLILEIWLRHPFRSFLMPDPYQLATVAGTRSYVLPAYFGRIASRDKRLQNYTTGGRIVPVDGRTLYDQIPGAGTLADTQTGQPSYYAIAGMVGALAQLPAGAASSLEVISDNALDTDVTVVVEGLDNAGVYNVATATLNGTAAAVAIPGTWTKLQNVSKMWPTSTQPNAPTSMASITGALSYSSSRGTVTLRNATDHVTVYQKLLPWESMREHWVLSFYPAPDAVYTINVPIIRTPRRSVYDADPVPSMWGPAIFEQMLNKWKASTGEQGGEMSNEALIALVAYDNAGVDGARIMSQAFGAGQL